MRNVGIELSLRTIADRAWRDRVQPSVHKLAQQIADPEPTVDRKVVAIVAAVRTWLQPPSPIDIEGFAKSGGDADDAVLAAATLCLSVGIPCRIVGARVRNGWTCWLAYLGGGGNWTTIDVLTGQRPAKADEELIVPYGPEEMMTDAERATVAEYEASGQAARDARMWADADLAQYKENFMASIAPLKTIDDYRRALEATLDTLADVLSTDPDMPGHLQTLAGADQWIDACRAALDEARRRAT